jgi:hypothetical protein
MNATVSFIINHFQFSHWTKLTSSISHQIIVRFENKYHLFVLDLGYGAGWRMDEQLLGATHYNRI